MEDCDYPVVPTGFSIIARARTGADGKKSARDTSDLAIRGGGKSESSPACVHR